MSNYIVSARKYRPTNFDDVVGQAHVTDTLKSALGKLQLAQAYLFTGPRGVGKTTCARILAKVVNCENPTNNNESCNECTSCKSFNENASFNVFELDAASNNSVDHIRMLIDEQVRYIPQKGKYKVFIIDEVHMLTKSAFNAFLKTLEEPPAHVIFILATTEKHKIIPTILSRCQIYDFRAIQVNDIVKQLKKIAEKEQIEYEQEALNIIARKAEGAMRDALSIFDRIVSASKERKILYKQVLEDLNLLDYDYYFKIVDYLLNSDLANVLLVLGDIVRKGFDTNIFITGLSEHIRQLLLSQDSKTHSLLEVEGSLKDRYIDQANLIDKSFALTALSILNKCDYNYPLAQNKRLHVEIALSKIAHINYSQELYSEENVKKKDSGPPLENTTVSEKETEIQKNIDTSEKKSDNKEIEAKKVEENVPLQKTEQPRVSKPLIDSSLSLPKMEDMMKEVEEEKKNKTQPIDLDFDNILKTVDEYKKNVKSQIVVNALNEILFEEENKGLKIFVPTDLSKEILSQERDLINLLREIHYNPTLDIEMVVDLKRFPEHKEIERKKILSTKEKYEILVKKNPEIQDFITSFDLHLD